MGKIRKYDAETGIREQVYQRGRDKYEVWQPDAEDPTTVLIDLASQVVRGRPATYENSPAGLEAFSQRCAEFFQTIQKHNETLQPDSKPWIPDIESLCSFCRISRFTLMSYSKRNEEWAEYIELVRTTIYGIKKSLAESFRMPPVLYIFDAKNNNHYTDSATLDIGAAEEKGSLTATVEEIKRRYSHATKPELPPELMQPEPEFD